MAQKDQKVDQSKQENIWNKILEESRTSNRFTNKNLLILGEKNSGKRSLLNSLFEISDTKFPLKSRSKGVSFFFIKFYRYLLISKKRK